MTTPARIRPPARARGKPRSDAPGGAQGGHQPARARLLAGGTEGNERLTVLTGLCLVVLLAALGVTIVAIGALLWLHLFLGLALIGPVVLKLASTGYRFARYYTRNRRYRIKGPPPPALRMLAPLVVVLTAVVFASGVALLLIGPKAGLRPSMFLIHKVSFIAWLVVTALHVLGHLPEILRFLRISHQLRLDLVTLRSTHPRDAVPVAPPVDRRLPGGAGRWLSLGTALLLGLVLAVALIPQFGTWTGHAGAAVVHHHHRLRSAARRPRAPVSAARRRSASVGQALTARRARPSSAGGTGAGSTSG